MYIVCVFVCMYVCVCVCVCMSVGGTWKDNQIEQNFHLNRTSDHDALIRDLTTDVNFLCDHNMMDYVCVWMSGCVCVCVCVCGCVDVWMCVYCMCGCVDVCVCVLYCCVWMYVGVCVHV